jgi:hypothetical protein
LLGFDCSMANRDLAAPSRHSVQSRIFIPFRGLKALLQPVAKIVPDSPPAFAASGGFGWASPVTWKPQASTE